MLVETALRRLTSRRSLEVEVSNQLRFPPVLKRFLIPASLIVLRFLLSHLSVLKRIGTAAFMGCISLQKVEIPGSVEELGGGLFAQCNVSNLTFSGEIDHFCVIDSVLVQKTGMNLYVPESGHDVEFIGERRDSATAIPVTGQTDRN